MFIRLPVQNEILSMKHTMEKYKHITYYNGTIFFG